METSKQSGPFRVRPSPKWGRARDLRKMIGICSRLGNPLLRYFLGLEGELPKEL
jgi:hypothetical protein